MNVVDTKAVVKIKLDLEQTERLVRSWGKHVIYGVLAAPVLTLLWAVAGPANREYLWPLCVMAYVYVTLMACLTANFSVDAWLLKRALARADAPFENCLFLPRDVAETKAHGKCSCELEGWERNVLLWAHENMSGPSVMRKDTTGYRFFFKNFEDYALFKLWV
jgi:hypothetical protein